ncbi:hypothetical protein GCM10023093_13510 [Nemorincola caseinilytica]|uniref:Uncharacterized protein n=2 Tax=Nemorincola caseinilytica TaxID=2054315 RepID=A0ABP8NAM7_9BACT
MAASCTREVPCDTPPLNGFTFISSAGEITDTGAYVERFLQGTRFKEGPLGYRRDPLKGDAHRKHFIADASVPTQDWRITLLPSGRQYLIEDIRVNQRKTTIQKSLFTPADDDVRCLNTYYYTRDSNITVATGDIQDGGLEIAY